MVTHNLILIAIYKIIAIQLNMTILIVVVVITHLHILPQNPSISLKKCLVGPNFPLRMLSHVEKCKKWQSPRQKCYFTLIYG